MPKTNPPFELPEEMRAMLDKGVVQAREGFEKVMEVASEAVGTLDQKADSAQAQATELRRKAIAFTQSNVAAAFDLTAKMVKATHIEEVMKLQSEYMATQLATLQGHMQEVGSAVETHARAAADEVLAQSHALQAKAKDALAQGMASMEEAAKAVTAPFKDKK